MVRKIDFSALTEEIKKGEAKQEFVDPIKEKLYQPKLKEDGTFNAIIRFLPRHEDDTDMIPYVKLMNHVFKTKSNQWVYENCPTTFGKKEKCPICEKNSEDWDDESKHDEIRKRTRRTNYYSNILVVQDPQNPENNDKVFIFRYGKKLFDKIVEKISPEDGSIDQPVNVFDYMEGQNFKLKIRQVSGYPNYDQSGFTGTSTPVYKEESKIDELDTKLHMLGEITSKDKFHSYAEIKENFESKMGYTSSKSPVYSKPKEAPKTIEEEYEEVKPVQKPKKIEVDPFDDDDDFINELNSD